MSAKHRSTREKVERGIYRRQSGKGVLYSVFFDGKFVSTETDGTPLTNVKAARARRGELIGCSLRGEKPELLPVRGHGQSNSPTYQTWIAMKTRCTNANHDAYPYYGGRGIAVCVGWLDSFEQFLADMGERPEGMSIDRLDVNGNYSCGHCEQCLREGWSANCHWATAEEQRANRRPAGGKETPNDQPSDLLLDTPQPAANLAAHREAPATRQRPGA